MINTSRPNENNHHFAEDGFKYIWLKGVHWFMIDTLMKITPTYPTDN